MFPDTPDFCLISPAGPDASARHRGSTRATPSEAEVRNGRFHRVLPHIPSSRFSAGRKLCDGCGTSSAFRGASRKISDLRQASARAVLGLAPRSAVALEPPAPHATPHLGGARHTQRCTRRTSAAHATRISAYGSDHRVVNAQKRNHGTQRGPVLTARALKSRVKIRRARGALSRCWPACLPGPLPLPCRRLRP